MLRKLPLLILGSLLRLYPFFRPHSIAIINWIPFTVSPLIHLQAYFDKHASSIVAELVFKKWRGQEADFEVVKRELTAISEGT